MGGKDYPTGRGLATAISDGIGIAADPQTRLLSDDKHEASSRSSFATNVGRGQNKIGRHT